MNKNLLLVEDEKLIREMYEVVFNQRGYKVETVEDGQEALDKLSNPANKYDLILLDIMLPKVDGISVLKKIKDPSCPAKDIPVFLLTNLGMDPLIKEALNLGAEKFLIKSNYLPQEVVDEVDAYFTSKHQVEQQILQN